MPKCPRIDAKDILIATLTRLGADGLCCDGCGCGLDDLVPCNSDPSGCVPAKKGKVRDLDEDARAEYDLGPNDDYYVEMDVPAEAASALGIASNTEVSGPPSGGSTAPRS